MAASFVQEVGSQAGTTPGTVTMAVASATTAGNDIFVVATVGASSAQNFTGISDTQGNTYVQEILRRHTGASVHQSLWVARGATALVTSDEITVTHSNGANNLSVIAFEFSGLTGGGDATIGAQSASAGTSYDTGSESVPAGDHLLFSLATGTGTRTFSPSGSGTWTDLSVTPAVAAGNRSGNSFYQIVSGGGTLQNDGTVDASTNWIADAISLPAAGGADHNETPDDDLGLDDAATPLLAQAQAQADDLGLTDSVDLLRTTLITVEDDLGLDDARALAVDKVVADDLGLDDAAAALVGQPVEDDLGLTDSVDLLRTTLITVEDDLGLTDARALDVTKVVADDLGLSDQAIAVTGPRDALGLTDSVTTTGSFAVSVSDSLSLLDAMADIAPGYLPGEVELASDGLSTAALATSSLGTADLLDEHGAAVLVNSAGTAVIDT